MDENAFKQLFLPFHRKLFCIAYRILSNANDAEDIIQETYIKLWTKRHEIGHISNAESFSIIVLKNTCLDFLRKTKNDLLTEYDYNIPSSISLSNEVEQLDQLNHVSLLMSKLSGQQQLVLKLKHWDGYSDEEIEQITGLQRGNIKVILSRARKMIKDEYLKLEQ
ncbi:MAG: RNA polymerase sigma factor [Dysgonamonadaceae bacterium]|jgi:RNA polymerase sigma-70 factor (ECF subfamily)|nr:RNA polymerase sigma factor [Dysgonamonadaceae bacterium]